MAATLNTGQKYDLASVELVGWKGGDEHADSTLSVWDYFEPDGTYKGPDCDGVEPIVELAA